VCDQETPKTEAKGPSWTISACERMEFQILKSFTITVVDMEKEILYQRAANYCRYVPVF
jgi:hypothetical protein